MFKDQERILEKISFDRRIKRADHVRYRGEDQIWATFRDKIDIKALEKIAAEAKFKVVTFGSIPSKLPKSLSEIVWNGVTHIITESYGSVDKLKSFLGFEPEGVAKIAVDSHGPEQTYIARTPEALRILMEYLGLGEEAKTKAP